MSNHVDGAPAAAAVATRDPQSGLDVAIAAVAHLVASAEPAVVFSSLAQLCVPEFSAACSVQIVEGTGATYRIDYPRAARSLDAESNNCGAGGWQTTISFHEQQNDPGQDYHGVFLHSWNTPTVHVADVAAARLLADYAVAVITQERLAEQARAAATKIENLEIALVNSRQIGAAIGILMVTRKVTDTAAFDLLRIVSQRQHRKLRDVAAEVVLTGCLDEGVSHVPTEQDDASDNEVPNDGDIKDPRETSHPAGESHAQANTEDEPPG